MLKLFSPLLGMVLLMTSVAHADEEKLHRTITVTGEGKTSARPDMATITTGVTSEDKSAKEAVNKNNQAMDALLKALKDQNIPDKDVITNSFQVNPIYQYDPKGEKPPTVTGYRVSNTVQVRVRNLDKLGTILDAVVQAGSNQISGISFSLSDPEPVLAKAREQAVKNAKSRAETYAAAAEVGVGKVLKISEIIDFPQPGPFAGYALQMDKAAASVPIAVGEQEFSVNVHLMYELVDVAE